MGAVSGNSAIYQAGGLLSSVATHAYNTSFTREFEREADRLAVETMVKAGWDPNGMLRMFETLQSEGGGGRSWRRRPAGR